MKKYLIFSEEEIDDIRIQSYNFFTNKKNITYIVILTIIFLFTSFYTYKKFAYPKIFKKYVANKEFSYGDSDNKILIMWFYTDWCPYCTQTVNEWNAFKDKITETDYDIDINFQEIDCDKNPEIADKYNIEEYPTIKLLYKNDIYLYDAKPDVNNLIKFLNGSLPLSSKYSTSSFSKKNIKKDIDDVGDGVKDTLENLPAPIFIG